jgi:hypothetical protein
MLPSNLAANERIKTCTERDSFKSYPMYNAGTGNRIWVALSNTGAWTQWGSATWNGSGYTRDTSLSESFPLAGTGSGTMPSWSINTATSDADYGHSFSAVQYQTAVPAGTPVYAAAMPADPSAAPAAVALPFDRGRTRAWAHATLVVYYAPAALAG